MRHALAAALGISILAGATSSVAQTQLADRTWVSSTGGDLNPCTRAAPCQTFAGAFLKTATDGEIDCVDSGNFGAVTITRPVTIDCNGVVGGIGAAGTTAVIVNTANSGVVILRNLEINGAGTGIDGIKFENGRHVIIENTKIFGFTRSGVWLAGGAGAGNLVITNSTISTTAWGIRADGGIAMVSHSIISGVDTGILAMNGAIINADGNILTLNRIAVQAGNGGTGQSAATVRLSNNDVYGNLTGFACGLGVLASAGNNRKGNNTGGSAPTCAPNAAITQQ